MKFLIRHRDYFRRLAIVSATIFNFFMIAASYTQEEGAWGATFLIAGISIVSAIICHITRGLIVSEKGKIIEQI